MSDDNYYDFLSGYGVESSLELNYKQAAKAIYCLRGRQPSPSSSERGRQLPPPPSPRGNFDRLLGKLRYLIFKAGVNYCQLPKAMSLKDGELIIGEQKIREWLRHEFYINNIKVECCVKVMLPDWAIKSVYGWANKKVNNLLAVWKSPRASSKDYYVDYKKLSKDELIKLAVIFKEIVKNLPK